jgi:phosphoribosylformylglycinamidine synthase
VLILIARQESLSCASKASTVDRNGSRLLPAGFEAVDVHMSDLPSGRINLRDFDGLVACGGFSYGDVLMQLWLGKLILFHDELRMQFVRFVCPDTFTREKNCNGC